MPVPIALSRSRKLQAARRTRPLADPGVPAAREPSPLHSFEALAGAVFVASMAACWIAVASTTTAPLVAASELLTRAARASDR
ncbi:MAG TPA: hypothetical protein VN634_04435 [Candidatus Limnocylindrales bacterium]|nr:hypothetical protein [Candidatus Limnocylindrales bacterium]